MEQIVKRPEAMQGCIWKKDNIEEFEQAFPECSFKVAVDSGVLYFSTLRPTVLSGYFWENQYKCKYDKKYPYVSDESEMALTMGDALIREESTGNLFAVNAAEFRSKYIIVPNQQQVSQAQSAPNTMSDGAAA